jgi:hypothetical protein
MTGPRAKGAKAPRVQEQKDEPANPSAFQSGLEILGGIQSAGFFAVGRALGNAPNPGLCVKALDSIGLPLSSLHQVTKSISGIPGAFRLGPSSQEPYVDRNLQFCGARGQPEARS